VYCHHLRKLSRHPRLRGSSNDKICSSSRTILLSHTPGSRQVSCHHPRELRRPQRRSQLLLHRRRRVICKRMMAQDRRLHLFLCRVNQDRVRQRTRRRQSLTYLIWSYRLDTPRSLGFCSVGFQFREGMSMKVYDFGSVRQDNRLCFVNYYILPSRE
jgi:LSD1 subclass zinc finger protein